MGRAKRDRALLLAGMMGSGKTCVGRLLAKRLDWEFIDTDERVETKRALSIAEIFEREGEGAFRTLERQVLESLPARDAVIALGGGAVVAEENLTLLKGKGTVVWLEASPEELARRVGAESDRPLLGGLHADERIDRLRRLLGERTPAYARADVRVSTAARTPEQVCEAVLEALGWEDAA